MTTTRTKSPEINSMNQIPTSLKVLTRYLRSSPYACNS